MPLLKFCLFGFVYLFIVIKLFLRSWINRVQLEVEFRSLSLTNAWHPVLISYWVFHMDKYTYSFFTKQ